MISKKKKSTSEQFVRFINSLRYSYKQTVKTLKVEWINMYSKTCGAGGQN